MATSTELVPAGEKSPFAALATPQQELLDLIEENLAGESVTARDLDRVKVPSGGGTTWEVPTVNGEEAVKELSGIIVSRGTVRAYWPTKEPSNEPPQCSSDDGITGKGEPGGECASCPLNQFGPDGEAKPCKEMRQLFLLTPDSLLPLVVTVPPGSLGNAKSYFMRLLRSNVRATDVVTTLSLEKAENKGGTKFARIVLKAGAKLSPDAAAQIREYADKLAPTFQQAASVVDGTAVAADA